MNLLDFSLKSTSIKKCGGTEEKVATFFQGGIVGAILLVLEDQIQLKIGYIWILLCQAQQRT